MFQGVWWKLPVSLAMAALVGVVSFAIVTGIRSCNNPNAPCIESAEIVTPAQTRRDCPPGARMSTENLPDRAFSEDRVLVRCTCAIPVDAGAR